MDWTSIFQMVLPYLPAKYAGDAVDIVTLLTSAALAMWCWKTYDAEKNIPLFQAAIGA